MARTNNLSEFLTDVAKSIKDKKGITEKIPAANFDTEIASIETGIDTSDATATAADIKSGSTAYAKDTKLTGTLTFDKFDPDYTNCLNKANQIEGSAPLENPYFVKSLTNGDICWDDRLSYAIKWITTVPVFDTSNVTNMTRMFCGCSNLVTISELNTSKVTTMNSMFYDCSKLTTIPLLDTSKVTNMSDMFNRCGSLVTIPLLNTSNVMNMKSIFASCRQLSSIPELNTSKVTNMNYMFNYCSALITIPQLDTLNVTYMERMFQGCTNLTSIPLLNTSKVTNMWAMFQDCKNLTTIPLLDTSKVTVMSYMVSNCPKLSDESLNNILQMCVNAKAYTGTKTLKELGLSQEQATKCQSLSNWSAFTTAGWTSGY